jgi:hypothetical protein
LVEWAVPLHSMVVFVGAVSVSFSLLCFLSAGFTNWEGSLLFSVVVFLLVLCFGVCGDVCVG